MFWRQDQIARGKPYSETACRDQDRRKGARLEQGFVGKVALADPADFLKAVVTGQNTIANGKGLHAPLALDRLDQRA